MLVMHLMINKAPCSSYHPASFLFIAIFLESAAVSSASPSIFSTVCSFLPYIYQIQLCSRTWKGRSGGGYRGRTGKKTIQGIESIGDKNRREKSCLPWRLWTNSRKGRSFTWMWLDLSGYRLGSEPWWAVNLFLCLAFWCYLRIDLELKLLVWKN